MSDRQHEQRVYDHRLRQLVQRSGDIRVATEIGVPRSTAAGWLWAEPQDVVTLDLLGMRETELQLEVFKLRKAYVHAVIDNFSRRILAFRVGAHFDVGNAIAVLMDAVRNATGNRNTGAQFTPMLMVNGGIENFNSRVDELVASGLLRRVLAQTEVSFSNSLIEAFWRAMKHQWLFLNTLDSVATVRRHLTFYVAAHNSEIPHAAFRGQTPDEMYFGRGADLPDRLAAAKKEALAARLATNREASCANCSGRLSPAKLAPDPPRETAAA